MTGSFSSFGFNVGMIGDRINPGFKSTKALLDAEDLAGVQALAVKQVEAGAGALDVTIGPREATDPAFLAKVVRAIQDAVAVPLCFDSPSVQVQEVCLKSYDRDRAGGKPAIINSITEQRWELMNLYKPLGPFQVIVMASERMEAGAPKSNKTADEIAVTAKRAALRLQADYGMALDDIYIDVSVSAVVADTAGLHRATLQAIRRLHDDPQLRGLHIMGGLTNIGQHLPPKAADGSDLKLSLECAFLTLAVPLGFDTILCTPWRNYHRLPDDNYVLTAYKNILEQTGSNALRAVRKLYRA
ncbi:MAG TPA: dihydropteroate synthase [Xanthobacteraceae bacterium]|nr:dihydropteroate synthase [Xanthobacteraceae bacterium]